VEQATPAAGSDMRIQWRHTIFFVWSIEAVTGSFSVLGPCVTGFNFGGIIQRFPALCKAFNFCEDFFRGRRTASSNVNKL
jgi:hypothetical protein